MPRQILLPLILVGLMLLVACGGEAAPAPSTTPEPAPEPGTMDLYLATCAICHGNQREGVTGLGKPLTPESLTDYSDADLSEVIREGRADTEMQGFKDRLSSQEIDGLIQLIKHTSP